MNAVDTIQQTALHYACSNIKPGVVRILLAQPGVDCNPRDEDGNTPLQLALEEGQAECVRVLVRDRRVELDTMDNDGTTLAE